MNSVNPFPITSKGLSPEDHLAWLRFQIMAEILVDTQLNIPRGDDLFQHVQHVIDQGRSLGSQIRMAEAILDKRAWRVLL